ncbi:MAG: hypothetical protein Q4A55_01560 [Aerococcus sp.]|nr:hypothetical protein [Aerococcus sp.]
MNKQTSASVDWSRVLIMAGAMIATIIGSGFATGQKIVQYFVSWGWWGVLGVIAAFIGFAFIGHTFLTVGYDRADDLKKPNDIYKVFCGKYLGTFYNYFSVFFLFLSYSIMISGAGTTIQQQFGLSYYVGAVIMLVVVVTTVALGLNKLTNVLGSLGPFITIATILLGIYSLVTNWSSLSEAPALIQSAVSQGSIKVASETWWLAALNYVGFNMIWVAAFLSQNGRLEPNRKQAGFGGMFGALGLCSAVLVMMFAFTAAFAKIQGSQVPTLILANNVHPFIGNFFSLIICLGIFTSAVPLLWSSVAPFAQDGTTRHKIFAVVLGIIGFIIGSSLKFDELVNKVYVLNGYVGILLIVIMIVYVIRHRHDHHA